MSARRWLAEYVFLLIRYNRMIWQEPWWDGRREPVAERMLVLFELMPPADRDEAMGVVESCYASRLAGENPRV